MKKFIPIIIVLVVVVAGGFGWYYLYGPCGTVPVHRANDQLTVVIDKFAEAFDVAVSTPRISLSPQIIRLQEIQDELKAVEVPSCMAPAKSRMEKSFSTNINALVMFMGQANDSEVNNEMSTGRSQMLTANDELNAIVECAPFCKADPYKRVAP